MSRLANFQGTEIADPTGSYQELLLRFLAVFALYAAGKFVSVCNADVEPILARIHDISSTRKAQWLCKPCV